MWGEGFVVIAWLGLLVVAACEYCYAVDLGLG